MGSEGHGKKNVERIKKIKNGTKECCYTIEIETEKKRTAVNRKGFTHPEHTTTHTYISIGQKCVLNFFVSTRRLLLIDCFWLVRTTTTTNNF